MAGVLLKVCMSMCVRDVCICARACACAEGAGDSVYLRLRA